MKETLGYETHCAPHQFCPEEKFNLLCNRFLQYIVQDTHTVHTLKISKKKTKHPLFRGQRSGTVILRRPQCFKRIFSTGNV